MDEHSDVIDVEAIIDGDVRDVSLLLDLLKVGSSCFSLCGLLGLLGFRSGFGLLLGTSGLSFLELLSLCLLLALDKLALCLLSVRLGWGLFLLLGSGATSLFFLLLFCSVSVLFLTVLALLQVLDEVGK